MARQGFCRQQLARPPVDWVQLLVGWELCVVMGVAGMGTKLVSRKADTVLPVVSLVVATLRFKRAEENRCCNLCDRRFTYIEGLKSSGFVWFCSCLFAFLLF